MIVRTSLSSSFSAFAIHDPSTLSPSIGKSGNLTRLGVRESQSESWKIPGKSEINREIGSGNSLLSYIYSVDYLQKKKRKILNSENKIARLSNSQIF